MNEVWLIAGMVVATYSVRWFLFGFANRIEFPPWFTSALTFIPVAILPALFVPQIVMPKGEVWFSLANPYLVSGVLAAAIAWRWKNLLLTIGLGLAIFIVLKWLV